MADHSNHTPTGYLQHALTLGLANSMKVLATTHHLDDNFSLTTTHLKHALDGSFLILKKERDSSTNNTHSVISLDDPYSYAMLATLEGPIRIQPHTLITIRGTNHSEVIHLNINPHIRSILSRTYYQLVLTSGTQELAPHITLPAYNPAKDLTGRRTDKLHWATVLLHNVDTLEVFKEAIRQARKQEPADP
jgi:hypothetical protein